MCKTVSTVSFLKKKKRLTNGELITMFENVADDIKKNAEEIADIKKCMEEIKKDNAELKARVGEMSTKFQKVYDFILEPTFFKKFIDKWGDKILLAICGAIICAGFGISLAELKELLLR